MCCAAIAVFVFKPRMFGTVLILDFISKADLHSSYTTHVFSPLVSPGVPTHRRSRFHARPTPVRPYPVISTPPATPCSGAERFPLDDKVSEDEITTSRLRLIPFLSGASDDVPFCHRQYRGYYAISAYPISAIVGFGLSCNVWKRGKHDAERGRRAQRPPPPAQR